MSGKELTFLKGVATGREFYNLLKSINVAKRYHAGQKRKSGEDYVEHPTRVASELLALNIKDDIILSTAMLHDILEDCPITKNQLIHDFGIDEIIVNNVELLTKNKNESTDIYYEKIKRSAPALLVKIADRVHNISTVTAFSVEKMKRYVKETEDYVIPLCDYGKDYYPEYSDQIFVMKYHIESMNKTVTNLLELLETKNQ